MTEVYPSLVCPACGFSELDLSKSLRLGCPQCYEVFGANLETMLPRLHHGTVHVGKSPKQSANLSAQLRRELNEIESLLVANQNDASRVDSLLQLWRDVSNQLSDVAAKADKQ